jgi:hypothetical protein
MQEGESGHRWFKDYQKRADMCLVWLGLRGGGGGLQHGPPLHRLPMGETGLDEETFDEYLDGLREHYRADKVSSRAVQMSVKRGQTRGLSAWSRRRSRA